MTSKAMQDPELAAMAAINVALDPLPEPVRLRVLAWARSRYMGSTATSPVATAHEMGPQRAAGSFASFDSFSSLGELIAACAADSDDGRVLVASVWVARQADAGSFTAVQVNSELKHLGHPIENITRVLDALIVRRPALVVQLRKSGTTRQARKLYKVTEAGTQEVLRMLTGG